MPRWATRPSLKRSMGLWMATALVVGNMIGSGVFLLPSALAAEAGPISLLAWIFTGAGALLLALVFAGLARRSPAPAAPMPTLVERSATSSASRPRGATGSPSGPATPPSRWPSSAMPRCSGGDLGTNGVLGAGVAIGVIWLLHAGQHRRRPRGRHDPGRHDDPQVRAAAPDRRRSGSSTWTAATSRRSPPAATRRRLLDDITAAATLTLWAFIGLESATVAAEEIKDPEKNLPRATILGTSVTTFVYIIATVAVMGIIPAATLADSSSPFADAAGVMWGGSWDKIIAGVAMISTFGALNGWILLQGRVPLAAAQDGLFPKRFAAVSGKRGTPVFGLVVLVRARQRAHRHELQREPGRPVQPGHPARDADHPRAVRLLGRGPAVLLLRGARALRREEAGARQHHRDAGLRLFVLDHLRLRRGDDRQGLPAAAAGIPVYVSCAGASLASGWRPRPPRRVRAARASPPELVEAGQ